MEIIWHGKSAFTIKGSKAVIALEPENENLQADIELSQQEPKTTIKNAKLLNWPGEFEVSGVSIENIGCGKLNLFVFNVDNFRICSLSTLNEDLTEQLFEAIGDVDILLMPVGGKDVLNAKQAQTIYEEIDPRICILSSFEGAPSEFLKTVGKTDLVPLEKFSMKARSELPEDKTEFVLLNIA